MLGSWWVFVDFIEFGRGKFEVFFGGEGFLRKNMLREV